MFSFGNEVLITEIIDAIERKEPVRVRSFPALLRQEPGLMSLWPRGELSRDTGAERMLGPTGKRNFFPRCLFLP